MGNRKEKCLEVGRHFDKFSIQVNLKNFLLPLVTVIERFNLQISYCPIAT